MMSTNNQGTVGGVLEHARVVVLAGIVCSAFACGTPGDQVEVHSLASPETTDDAEPALREAVKKLGFDTSGMVIRKDTILVEDDIILYRDKLLAGRYAPVPKLSALNDKGYHTALVSQSTVTNIGLRWASGDEYPSDEIRSAVVFAATWDWSGNNWPTYHSTRINISESNTGPAITVHAIDGWTWVTGGGPCKTEDWACADYPWDGNPGANMYVRADLNPAENPFECDWTNQLLVRMAAHELGHALGVTHPNETGSTQVSGTGSCAGSATDCVNNAGYATVMTNIDTNYPNCAPAVVSLTPDDLALASALYPP